MYLYDKTKRTIDVYTMTSNNQKSADFKKSEMQKSIPAEERILKASTNDEKELENIGQPISWSRLQRAAAGAFVETFWHNVNSYQMSDEEKIRQAKLLNNYYNGNFIDKPVALIEDYNKETSRFEIIKYFLLTKSYAENNQEYIMDDIISVPESLYYLQLLEQGMFHKIADEDISRQLQTFDISDSPIKRISISELRKMYDVGLLPGCFEGIMQNVETTQKILRKIR